MLLPPKECPNLELYPRGHPSARHSAVDWSNLRDLEQYPALYNASATEVSCSSKLLLNEIMYTNIGVMVLGGAYTWRSLICT